MTILLFIFKALNRLQVNVLTLAGNIYTKLYLSACGAIFGEIKSVGIPYLSLNGKLKLGNNAKWNSMYQANPIGRNSKCQIFISKDASLEIGSNFSGSSFAIVCHKNIKIGNFVKLGGGVCIYDTDFHSLNYLDRKKRESDQENTQKSQVEIGDNVFIGAHSTILKGVSIGENSIIGACSVITKNIPANQIWAGNPAKKIRSLA